MKRNPELEAAIVAAPDDPAARMIYGDWLQAEGDPRGEWAALRTRLEASPDDREVRLAAIEFEGARKRDLFGAGEKAIARAYVGWRGGFVDELRIQPHPSITAAAIKGLIAHPTVRFLRHLAIGPLSRALRTAAIDALVGQQLPLLAELVLHDAQWVSHRGPIERLEKLRLTKLSLSGAWPTAPMRELRELTLLAREPDLEPIMRWLRDGGCPGLEKLTLVDEEVKTSRPLVRAALAHGAPNARFEHLRSSKLWDPESIHQANPILELAREGGRDAVKHIPMAGVVLYNAATYTMIAAHKNAKAAIPFLDIAATLPTHLTGTYQLANAAIAHERAGDLLGAELRAREAMLYSPREPNYYAIAIDAMRRTNRLAEAMALLPRAIKAISTPPKDKQAMAEVGCLLDCMMLLAQVGKHDDAIALAEQFERLADARIHAALAVIHVERGDLKEARAAWKRAAGGEEFGIWHHAMALFAKTPADRNKAIAGAKKAGYGDLAWLQAMLKT